MTFEVLEIRQVLSANPIITEFMADNAGVLEDGNNPAGTPDWIEIQNAGDTAIDLLGWHLTDDADELDKWTFPSTTLQPGEFLVVFASGDDTADAGGNLHTNFRLNAQGEYLALSQPDSTIVSQFGPGGVDFPLQLTDVSYGIGVSEIETTLVDSNAAVKYLVSPGGSLPVDWNQIGGDETGFADGTNGLGYNLEQPPESVPGFTARMVNVSSQITTVTTADSILANPTAFGLIQDVSQVVQEVDFAGGVGSFGVDNPYPNGQSGTVAEDFIVHISADVIIPAGTWQIAFASDDGGRLNLDGANFASRFESSGELSADQIRFEGTRGHNWTGGTFTTAAELSSALDALMFERGGGDSFEIAIRDASGGENNTVSAAGGWQLLADGIHGWSISTSGDIQAGEVINPAGVSTIGTETITGTAGDNVALAGTATQSSTGAGRPAQNAINGNLAEPGTHTAAGTNTPSAWQVLLAETTDLSQIVLYNRTDCCQTRFRDITVEVLDFNGNVNSDFAIGSGGTVKYRSQLLNPENQMGGPSSLTIDLSNEPGGIVSGNFIRVIRTPDPDLSGTGGVGNADEADVLTLNEVQVFSASLGDLDLSNNATLQVEVNGDTDTADKLVVGGTLTLGGSSRLEVNLLAGGLEPGDSFDIIDATTLSGTFNQLALPLPGVGLMWDTSALHTTGVISVVVNPNAGGEDPLPGNSTNAQIQQYENLLQTDLETQMFTGGTSVMVRIPFTVENAVGIESLRLRMKYDDGFVAYINGQEVARSNAPSALSGDSAATAERTKAQAIVYQDIPLSILASDLNIGPGQSNVLAILGLNLDPLDNDFLLLSELTGVEVTSSAQRYFGTPTPGQTNDSGFVDVVSTLDISHERGFYDTPFNVVLSTDTLGATIRYTLDGTSPTADIGTVYAGPIPVSRTTTLRAIATKDDFLSPPIETNTYIFVDDVVTQSPATAISYGLPSSWGGQAADYGMDPDVVGPNDLFGGKYADSIRDDLLAIPTLSVVMDIDDIFGGSGIYSNSTSRGDQWERPTSVELIYPDGTDGFQIDAGIRIQGGAFRSFGLTRKKSFRLSFKSEYGPSKLEFPLFGDEGATDRFDAIVLRANANDAWNSWGGGMARSQYLRDQWGRSMQLAMEQPGSRGTYMHLYINGQYWGLYNPVERTNASFGATYVGGDKDNWDAINSGSAVSGSTAAWNTMVSLAGGVNTANQDTSNDAYQRIQGNNPDGTNNPAFEDYLDVDNMIDYMIINLYGGNSDWPQKNFWVGRERGADSTGFKFYMWDSEWSLGMNSSVTANRVGVSGNVAEPYARLKANEQFQLLFADHLQRHFFNGGALYTDPLNPQYDPAQPERNMPAALYAELASQIERGIVGESARWGDMSESVPRSEEDWATQRDSLLSSYFPQRAANVLNQFRSAGLYPNTAAPAFNIDGQSQHGGGVTVGAQLTMSNPNGTGTIYYTTDGTDPRHYDWTAPNATTGASVSGSAVAYSAATPLAITGTTTVKSRVLSDSGDWSALNEATYTIILSDLRITEVNFNPADPTPQELAIDSTFDNDDFEFIELKNIGQSPINLADARITDGIAFDFAAGAVTSLAPGEYLVVVRNQAAFDARYDSTASNIQIAGQFDMSLDNGGEKIELIDGTGEALVQFEYNDSWFDHTDGGGFSLTVLDELDLFADLNQKSNWRASNRSGGSPGEGDSGVMPEAILINEVLANSTGQTDGDWIELFNTTAQTIDIGNWWLSDSADQLAKYRFAPGTLVPANGFLVVYEASHFGVSSSDLGAVIGFDFSEHGATAFLTGGDSDANLLGYRESQSFDASKSSESPGLYTKSNGGTDFVRLASPTPGTMNTNPIVGPLVINEIMYSPASSGVEFIELHNISAASISLDDAQGNSWRIRGAIDYAFPAGESIPAGGYLVLIQGADGGDATAESLAFRISNSVPTNVQIFVYTDVDSGSLSNGGEKIFLDQPGDPNSGLPETPYVLIDAVRYDNNTPWPTVADGTGSSLSRTDSNAYGNDVANWLAGTIGGTPGELNVGIDTTPPTAPTDLEGRIVSNTQTRLDWTEANDPQTGVVFYNVYRNGAIVGSPVLPLFTDEVVFNSNPLLYEVTAVNSDGMEGPRSSIASVGAQSISFQDGVNGYTGSRDTELRQALPSQNQGTDTNLEVDGDDSGGVDLSVLVKWDIAGLPAGSVVVGAQISLDVTNQSSGPYQVSQVLKDWNESQATWNQFATGQPWQTAGALGSADRGLVAGTIISASTGKQTIDFTEQGVALIQSWADADAGNPNYGFVIANTSSTDGLDFSSREVTAPGNRPQLTIVYLTPPEPLTPGDVNLDGNVDDADIDLVHQAIAVNSADPAFDINGDTLVNANDVTTLVEDILGTKIGDTDLNGSVDRRDVRTLLTNFAQIGGEFWTRGDFNGDGRIGLLDLGRLQSNVPSTTSASPAAAAAIVVSQQSEILSATVFGTDALDSSQIRVASARRTPSRITGPYSPDVQTTGDLQTSNSNAPLRQMSRSTLRARRATRRLDHSAVDALFTTSEVKKLSRTEKTF